VTTKKERNASCPIYIPKFHPQPQKLHPKFQMYLPSNVNKKYQASKQHYHRSTNQTNRIEMKLLPSTIHKSLDGKKH
jgi:hypothetical protein